MLFENEIFLITCHISTFFTYIPREPEASGCKSYTLRVGSTQAGVFKVADQMALIRPYQGPNCKVTEAQMLFEILSNFHLGY